MKLRRWIMILFAASMLVGCGSQPERLKEVPVSSSGEEDAYQTSVFAQSRAEWEQQAAQGDMTSQRKLGVMYLLGQGIDTDYDMALEWFNKAAAQGEDIAQYQLGRMCAEGKGVAQSNVQAHMWYSLAAQQGNESARSHLDELTEQMTAAEIGDAQKLADEWTPTL